MVDIGTGLVLWGGKDIVTKVLGPTADYVGNEAKNLVEKSNKNIGKIFSRAAKLLGLKLEKPGLVNPRVLRRIITEGAFCDDDLSAEYFGGVLASSRSEITRDDRAVFMLSIINSMSTYQIRIHFIFYTILKKLFEGKPINIGLAKKRKEMKVFVPFDFYKACMDFSKEENVKHDAIISHIIYGLLSLDLLDEFFFYGDHLFIKAIYPPCDVKEGGVCFVPTVLGVELYLWAHGYPDVEKNIFLNKYLKFSESKVLRIPDGGVIVK